MCAHSYCGVHRCICLLPPRRELHIRDEQVRSRIRPVPASRPPRPPTPFIHIPASKTDTFRKGIDVFLPTGIPDDDSPTTALRVLLESFPGPLNSPLFTLSPLQPSFPRKTVIDRYLSLAMREADIRGEFSGHSFRRGAATWAASVGCSAEDIKALDRWKSSSFERYIDIPNSRKHDLVSSMFLQTSSLSGDGVVHPSSVFDPDL